ncbi:MAG: cytochrome ubiquinol oxidase subunit I [Candidatus Omnitrophota bacterium]
MDPLILSRLQFAVTTAYHFLFVPVTIGLGFMVALMETFYVVTKDALYLRMTKFWAKFFLISVAMGVATGIVLEFQFGLNWARFSRYVGDVFGPPLAIESWSAFFLESVFIGVWLVGWNKISPKLHVLSIWLVTVGAALSAFWIICANAFMQEPAGHVIRNGRIELVDIFALLFNPKALLMFWHTIFACLATAAFFVVSVCAYHFLKKTPQVDFFKRSLRIACLVGLVGILGVIGLGHSLGMRMAQYQPMKMAAAEAVWESRTDGHYALAALIDEKNRTNKAEISVPLLLNVLAFGRLDGRVPGLNELQKDYEQKYGPGNYLPPVTLIYWSFRVMVGSGFMMFALLFGLLIATMFRKLVIPDWCLWALIPTAALPPVANTAGWIVTEVGRQPWVIYGLLKTSDGVTANLDGNTALGALMVFTALYTILAIVAVSLAVRQIRQGPAAAGGQEGVS